MAPAAAAAGRPNAEEGPASLKSEARPRASTPPPRREGGQPKPNPEATAPPAAASSAARLDAALLRAGFVRKVYGILAAQLSLTVLAALACAACAPLRGLLVRTQVGGWMNLLIFLPTAACLAGLRWKKDAYPQNYCLLLGLTLLISLDVGVVSAVLADAGRGMVVVQAAAITLAMFLGLTAYVFYSGRDFSSMRGLLTGALWSLVVGGGLSLLLGAPLLHAAMAWLGAAAFCGYILYDTDRIATKLGHGDYIAATAELHLAIINLFLHVPKILLQREKGKKDEKHK